MGAFSRPRVGGSHWTGRNPRRSRTSRIWWLAAIVFVGLMFAIVLALSTLASATARLAIDTTVRFYWQCTLIFAVLAVSSALFMRLRS